jgi:hypothetical protein
VYGGGTERFVDAFVDHDVFPVVAEVVRVHRRGRVPRQSAVEQTRGAVSERVAVMSTEACLTS